MATIAVACSRDIDAGYTHRRSTASLDVDGATVNQQVANIASTCPFYATGSPVVVVPVGHSAEGLPVGIQVVGRRRRDLDLLAVAELVADVSGPFQRPPGYSKSAELDQPDQPRR